MSIGYSTETGDLPVKGVGYLTVYEPEALSAGVKDLLGRGATTIYAGGAVREEERDGLILSYSHDVVRMSRELAGMEEPDGSLELRALTRAEGAQFLSVYNECFINILSRPSQSMADLAWLLSEDFLAGTAFVGETPVGIYECKKRGESAELAALGILPSRTEKGLGRQLMRGTAALLRDEGYHQCTLKVSTANKSAIALARSEGFVAREALSSWYLVRPVRAL